MLMETLKARLGDKVSRHLPLTDSHAHALRIPEWNRLIGPG